MFCRERVIATSSVAVFLTIPRVAKEFELQPVVTAYNRVREAKMCTMYRRISNIEVGSRLGCAHSYADAT
jgi:hypothetical protein